jgi:aminoglycoside 6'-N-acetyltransferase
MNLRGHGLMVPANEPAQEALSGLVLSDGEITVRPASAADEDRLFAWFTDPEVYRWWGGEPKTREYALRHAGVMNDEDGTAWPFIVLRESEAIGYLQLWRDNNGTAGLDMLLAPAFRGHGFAARAASAVARYLCDAGWPQLTVDPAVGNVRAIRMWEKAGFAKTGEIVDVGDGPSELMVFRGPQRAGTESPWT